MVSSRETESGVNVSVFGTESNETRLDIGRYYSAGIGKGAAVDLGISADMSVKAIDFSVGAYGSIGGNVVGSEEFQVGYTFDYLNTTFAHSLAAFALMNRGIAGDLSPALLGALLYAERNWDSTNDNILEDAYKFGGRGSVKKGAGWAQAQITGGLLPPGVPIDLRVDLHAGVGWELIGGSRHLEYHEASEYFSVAAYELGVSGWFDVGAEIETGIDFSPLPWSLENDPINGVFEQHLPGFFEFFDQHGEYTIIGEGLLGGKLEIWKDSSWHPLSVVLSVHYGVGLNGDMEIKNYTITAQSTDQHTVSSFINKLGAYAGSL